MFGDKLPRVYQFLKGILTPSASRKRRPLRRYRPRLEDLEERVVPASFVWTDAAGGNLWSTAGNWSNTVTHGTGVPGSGDYALFGTDEGGSTANCYVTASESVDRVVMDHTYTGTLTIASGDTLAMANEFDQYGTLDLVGSAAVRAQGNVYVNGTVTDTPAYGAATPALLSAAATLYVEPGAAATAIGGVSGFPGGLTLSAGAFDDAGTFSAGTAGGAEGLLTVTGSLVEDPTGIIDVYARSDLVLGTGGNSSALADLKGSLGLLGTGAEVANAQPLWVDGGTLSSIGTGTAADMITGSVAVYNGGTMTVGTGAAASALDMTTGSLTVGAQAPGLSNTGGTLDLDLFATLAFPAAAGSSTFVVQGGPGPAELNMYGATITMAAARVASLELDGGTLNSNGSGGPVTDTIGGNLSVTGTPDYAGSVQFAGAALHTLAVTGSYTQTADGTLDERLDNGTGGGLSPSDVLAVTGTASLGGVYNLTALHSLSPNQTWHPITYGTNPGPSEFDTFNPPDDGNPDWAIAYLAGAVQITNF